MASNDDYVLTALQGAAGTLAVGTLVLRAALEVNQYVEREPYEIQDEARQAAQEFFDTDMDDTTYAGHAAVEGVDAPDYEDVMRRTYAHEYGKNLAESTRGFYSHLMRLATVAVDDDAVAEHECLHKLMHIERSGFDVPRVTDAIDELDLRLTEPYEVKELDHLAARYDVPVAHTEVLSVEPADYERIAKRSAEYQHLPLFDGGEGYAYGVPVEECAVRYLVGERVDLANPAHALRGYELTRQEAAAIDEAFKRIDKAEGYDPAAFLSQAASLTVDDINDALDTLPPVRDHERHRLNGTLLQQKPDVVDAKDRVLLDVVNAEEPLPAAKETVLSALR